MIDLSTTYLGLELRSPVVLSACPLSENVANIKRAEDAGVGAVVLYSLFEEQIRREREALHYHLTQGTESYAEALTYFPEPEEFRTGPEEYLDLIAQAKEAVDIPIIASLNATALGGWTKFATTIEQAGPDALELNIYSIPTDMTLAGAQIEQNYLDIVRAVWSLLGIPVAVKVSPYFSNMANMAKRLDDEGAHGLVLFNRFYQPDIDLETLEVKPNVLLSTPQALRLPLRWVAILYGRIKASLAATGGIHTAEDVVKVTMAGANVAMMASAPLKHGIDYLGQVDRDLRTWLEEHEYESISQMRGSLSQQHSADPSAFERAQYMRAVSNYPSTL
jgi:dihydroorotate dehydrogenase (fumarate)